jgi:hypothetical protein
MVTVGGGLVVATAGGPPVTTAGITVIVPGAQIAMGTVVSIAVRAGTLSSTLLMAANDMAAEEAKEVGAPAPLDPLSKQARDSLRSSARDIWQERTGRRAAWDGMDVHHRIPLEWSHLFPKSDPNRISNLIGMTPTHHTHVSNAWNAWRQSLYGRVPTQAEVLQQAMSIDEQFAHWMRFLP